MAVRYGKTYVEVRNALSSGKTISRRCNYYRTIGMTFELSHDNKKWTQCPAISLLSLNDEIEDIYMEFEIIGD